MKTRGKWLLVTAAAFVLFSSVTARAGEHYCWATGALGDRATCKISPSAGKCTITSSFVRFNAGCPLCTLTAVRCDVDSLSNDLRVDLCTTNTNYTDSQNNVAIGFTSDTGSGIAIGCDNFGADSVEMALVGTCN